MLDHGKGLFEGHGSGLSHVEVLLARIGGDGNVVLDGGGAVVLLHDGAADAAAYAGRHFNEALMDAAAFNILEGGDAVLHAVQGEIGIAGGVLGHGLENTAGGGEKAGAAFGGVVHFLFKGDPFGLEPVGQLLKGQDRIHEPLIMLRLVLLGHARPNEDGLGSRHPLFDIRAVCLHGGHNVRKVFQRRGVVFLDQQIDRMTAGGDDDIPILLAEHPLILVFDDGGADGGLLHVEKAQLFQGSAHGFDTDPFIVGDKGGSQADHHGIAALEEDSGLLGAVYDLLGVLGTNNKTMTAQNALIADDMGLVSRKADGLYGTVTDTLIAVFAVGFFQRQAICHSGHFLSFSITSRMFFLKNSLKFSLVTPT